MKEKIMPLLMLLAIAGATVAFSNKWHGKTDGIDKMQTVLQGAKAFIKPGSRITFQNYPIKNELHFQARYVLVPSYVPFHKYTFDTILSITPLTLKDNVNTAFTQANRRMLWQTTDADYSYALTTAH